MALDSQESGPKTGGSLAVRMLGFGVFLAASWVFYDPDLFAQNPPTEVTLWDGNTLKLTPYNLKFVSGLFVLLGGSIYFFGRGREA